VILFLDFDGVMHPFNQTNLFCREESLARFLRDFPEVEVVISSSWRETHTLKNMLTFFLTDLRSRIVGVTPVIEIRDAADVHSVRLREIKKYLIDTGNQHSRWVALDDTPELFSPKCAELVLCDGNHGFGEAEEQILRAWLQHKPESPAIEHSVAMHPVTNLKGMIGKKDGLH
jgi:HAD domain in Swiss Army Knife RNA repair proteins